MYLESEFKTRLRDTYLLRTETKQSFFPSAFSFLRRGRHDPYPIAGTLFPSDNEAYFRFCPRPFFLTSSLSCLRPPSRKLRPPPFIGSFLFCPRAHSTNSAAEDIILTSSPTPTFFPSLLPSHSSQPCLFIISATASSRSDALASLSSPSPLHLLHRHNGGITGCSCSRGRCKEGRRVAQRDQEVSRPSDRAVCLP